MKTIRFDCNGHNAPAYSCNKPYDNSGEYVPAAVAQGLYDALDAMEKMASDCDDGQYMDYPNARGVFESARDALAAADGEDI